MTTFDRIVAPDPIDAPFLHERRLDLPVLLGLQLAVGRRRARDTSR